MNHFADDGARCKLCEYTNFSLVKFEHLKEKPEEIPLWTVVGLPAPEFFGICDLHGLSCAHLGL